jgi:hypothetical protein
MVVFLENFKRSGVWVGVVVAMVGPVTAYIEFNPMEVHD